MAVHLRISGPALRKTQMSKIVIIGRAKTEMQRMGSRRASEVADIRCIDMSVLSPSRDNLGWDS